MEKSEQINELAAALSKAQGEFKPLTKGRTATVKMKSGEKYSYSYADLHDVVECVKQALSKNGLAVSQSAIRKETSDVMLTYLFHSSGQFISNSTPIIAGVYDNGGPQAFASSLTYSRRYGLCALLSVVADEDDDSQVAEVNHNNKEKNKPAAPSEAQIKRLFAICKESNWKEQHLRDHMKKVLGIESTKDLTWLQYDNLCKVIQSMPKTQEQVNH